MELSQSLVTQTHMLNEERNYSRELEKDLFKLKAELDRAREIAAKQESQYDV